ncbi:ExeM/NucH family extracellular endonuclease [Agromyces sp. NPDC058110]|uniref:ExeM/NucH family extracellular endonuclease n=1 Tax=Agromyces sp. NPDC058110 TaxID=3346345 RepID=UPI0036DC13DA
MQGDRRIHRLSAAAVTAAGALLVGMLGAPPAFAATDGSGVVINEVYARGGSANQPFANKFVELYNPTDSAVSLAGWSLQYRSATGTGAASGVGALSGSIPAKGYFLVGMNSNGPTGAALPTPDVTTTLAPSGTTGSIFLANVATAVNPGTGSIVNAPNVVDFVGYGGSNSFEGALVVYGDGVVAPANNVAGSISRTGGVDTDSNAADFAFSATPTPQNSGGGSVDPEPEPLEATIAEVQGDAADSPLVGETVTVQGVITADYRTGGYNGVTIQTPGPDTTPGVSDGVFVFGMPAVGAVGDLVQVTGEVSEYFGLTEITVTDAADAEVVAAGAGVPDAQPLPDTLVGSDREALESMLVAPSGTYLLSSTHEVYNYGSLWMAAGSSLPVKSTEQVDAGADANAIAAANRGKLLILDDGWNAAVTSAGHPADQPYLTKDQVVRNGDRVILPTTPYVLSYGFDAWRLQPTAPIDSTSPASVKPTFETLNPRVETAPEVGGDIQVGVFNVLNYFTTLSSENSNARGAATAEEFALQETKIVKAITALNAEVVALQEIENSFKLGEARDEATATLVAALNEAEGSDVWAFVPTPAVLTAATTDFIQSAIIYRTDAVTPKGDAQTVVDESVWGNAREPIGQVFELPNGNDFSVVANHFKSKSGSGTQPADGQGFFNADRVAQAQSLLTLADSLADEAGEVFLLGDFNSYAEEDPIQVLTEAGYSDLLPDLTDDQYTYTFDGELGSLDHALGNAAAVQGVTGIGRWAINSPEWSDRQYENGSPDDSVFRSSDHDPQVIGLDSSKLTDVVDISVMTINDFHGRIEQAFPSGGAAVLAGAADWVRAQNPNTVFAAAGDLIGASTFTSFIQQDTPTIESLNAAGLDVSAAGNHEFDRGWADLRDRVQSEADFEYISSNVFLKGTNTTALAPYYTKELEGVTVGFIGAVTEDLPSLVSPGGITELDVRPIVESVNTQAENLTDGDPANGEADVLILLVHEGAATVAIDAATDNSVFGKLVAGIDPSVDAIVSAHTHLAYNHVVDGRPVVSAGQYGEQFGLMQIRFDPTTDELVSISNELKPLTTPAQVGPPPVPAKANYPADPEVAAIVAKAKADAAGPGSVKLGDITADFNRAREANNAEARGAESTLGNFVADVQLWAAKQDGAADIAFMNPGGLRTDLKFATNTDGTPKAQPGAVTYAEAASVQPFANTLFTQTLTGAQIKQVFEEQWQPAGAARPFLKLGVSKGLEVVYDPTAAAGSRVAHISLDGVELDPAGEYRVVVNSFLATGGDNFFTLGKGTGRVDTGKVDLQAMVDWFAANKTATPDVAQRSVGLVLPAPADGTAYQRGESFDIAMSSLDFSTNEVAAGQVTVSIGGIAVGTAPVDRTPVATTDEGGRATLTVTVPEGVSGATALEIAVASTGTSVSVPITVEDEEVPPTPVSTITVGAPTSLLVRAGGSVTYKAQVFATDGSKPVGTVSVFDGSKLVATVDLTAAKNGRVSVTVPKLSRGPHLLRAEFDGTEPYTDSRMFSIPVLAW